MSILDQIIDATSPRIISENNNLDQIHIEESAIQAAVAGQAGISTWDAAEYGISAEQAAKMIAEAKYSRSTGAVMADLKRRALARFGMDVNEKGEICLMVAVGPNGEMNPWHRLGTLVADAISGMDALMLSKTNWKVVKVPAMYMFNGEMKPSTDTFLLIREDNGAELGRTGKGYKPIQNEDGVAFLDEALKEFGARYETAGSIYGGKRVWLQCRLPKSFQVQNGDQIDTFASFHLAHDGFGAVKCFPTTQRSVCANTYRLSLNDTGKGISIRHTGEIKGKIESAKKALGLAIRGFESFKDKAEQMVKTPLELEPYANDVLDAVLDVTEAQMNMGADVLAAAVATTEAEIELATKTYQRQIDRRSKILDSIIDRYESDRCSPRGSAWAAFNACTEEADYGFKRYTGDNKNSRRLESVLVGDADNMKQVAYNEVVKVMAN